MPARSNLFQKLVFLVKKQAANEAVVTESRLLRDRSTGANREVDICIEGRLAGHDVLVSIECTKRGRKADVKWVEEMKGKHERLPTDILVLASESGFSREAKSVAALYGIETLELKELDGASVEKLFGKIEALFLKLVSLHPTKVLVHVGQTGTLPPEVVNVLPANSLFTEHGEFIGSMREFIDALLSTEWFIREITRDGNESHHGFLVEWGNPTGLGGSRLCLQKEEPKVLRTIERIQISGICHFSVSRFPLKHAQLGQVRVAWSTGEVGGQSALLVASEHEAGGKRLTISTEGQGLARTEGPPKLKPDSG